MKTLGNIIWIIFGGLIAAIGCVFVGLLLSITIIGIPLGKQCFKMGELILSPFGKNVKSNYGSHPIANTIWLIFIGFESAIVFCVVGIIYCITIIGIPFGKQWFKLATLILCPFGAKI